jgi:YD repeat-containing protein
VLQGEQPQTYFSQLGMLGDGRLWFSGGYDAENHQVSANDGQSFGVSTYAYDGDGRRVRKVTATGSATTIFVYNAVGYVLEKSIEARKEQAEYGYEQEGGTGLSEDALETFGQVTHPLTDNTSPAHTGFQVYTLHIDDADTPIEAAGAAVQDVKGLQEHKKMESRPPTAAERRRAIKAMQTTFRSVFGDEAYKRAIKQPRPARHHEEE